MSNHRQKLTSIDAPFSKGGGEKKKKSHRDETLHPDFDTGACGDKWPVCTATAVCVCVCGWVG